MKSFTVRLPESLVADIEAESRGRRISKSDVVRERLQLAPRKRRKRDASLDMFRDGVAVRRSRKQGSENQQFKRSLQQINTGRHIRAHCVDTLLYFV